MPKYEQNRFSFGDPNLVSHVEWLKNVIVLGRMCRRDKCKINSLKTPLAKVTVIHEDAQVINSLK